MHVFRIRYKKYIELYINICMYLMKEISDLFTCVNLLFYLRQLVHIFLCIYLWSVSLFLCIYLWHHKMTYFKQQENCYFSFLTANKWIKRSNFCLLFRVSIKNVSIDYNFAFSFRSLSFSHKGHMRLSFLCYITCSGVKIGHVKFSLWKFAKLNFVWLKTKKQK